MKNNSQNQVNNTQQIVDMENLINQKEKEIQEAATMEKMFNSQLTEIDNELKKLGCKSNANESIKSIQSDMETKFKNLIKLMGINSDVEINEENLTKFEDWLKKKENLLQKATTMHEVYTTELEKIDNSLKEIGCTETEAEVALEKLIKDEKRLLEKSEQLINAKPDKLKTPNSNINDGSIDTEENKTKNNKKVDKKISNNEVPDMSIFDNNNSKDTVEF